MFHVKHKRRISSGKNYRNSQPEGWRRKNYNCNQSCGMSCKKGKKVLAIDMDPQGNMTSGLGVDKNSLEYSVYDMLNGDCNLGECMLIDVYPDIKGLNLLPASRELAGAEVEFVTVEDPQYILKNHIKNVRRKFDYIIIDCPPALGMLTVNALTAANTVLVPIQCEFFALDGLSQLIYTVNLIRKQLNRLLTIEGIVFTMYDSRTNLSMQVVDNVKQNLNQHIYNTIIPRNVRLAESQAMECQSLHMIHDLPELNII